MSAACKKLSFDTYLEISHNLRMPPPALQKVIDNSQLELIKLKLAQYLNSKLKMQSSIHLNVATRSKYIFIYLRSTEAVMKQVYSQITRHDADLFL